MGGLGLRIALTICVFPLISQGILLAGVVPPAVQSESTLFGQLASELARRPIGHSVDVPESTSSDFGWIGARPFAPAFLAPRRGLQGLAPVDGLDGLVSSIPPEVLLRGGNGRNGDNLLRPPAGGGLGSIGPGGAVEGSGSTPPTGTFSPIIPLPSTGAMAVAGLLGILGLRRRPLNLRD